MTAQDPHQDLHEHAASDTQHDEPVQAGEDDWHTALDKLNKALTKRINDLRTDTDAFKTATSKSVQALTGDVSSAKTAIQNNKDAIEAQDGLIEEASKKADAAAAKAVDAAKQAQQAKQAADAAAAAAQKAATDLKSLDEQYQSHVHDVKFTFDGTTNPPTKGGQ